jgi:hypothetical protein
MLEVIIMLFIILIYAASACGGKRENARMEG